MWAEQCSEDIDTDVDETSHISINQKYLITYKKCTVIVQDYFQNRHLKS